MTLPGGVFTVFPARPGATDRNEANISRLEVGRIQKMDVQFLTARQCPMMAQPSLRAEHDEAAGQGRRISGVSP